MPARIWRWDEGAHAALVPHARSIEVLAPLPGPGSSPLPQLALLPRLRVLTLRHMNASALPSLAGLTTLEALNTIGALRCGCNGL